MLNVAMRLAEDKFCIASKHRIKHVKRSAMPTRGMRPIYIMRAIYIPLMLEVKRSFLRLYGRC